MVPYYHRDERSLPFVFRVCPENFPILIDKITAILSAINPNPVIESHKNLESRENS